MNQNTVVCGVDVAKHSFTVSIKNGKALFTNKSFPMDNKGFSDFEQTIKNFKNNIIIGMEPTGIYHNNLFSFLTQKGYNSIVINPYMLHQFFKFTNNKPTKTDKKDSKTIAEFVEFKKDELMQSKKPYDERSAIRYFVREKEKISQDIAKTKTEIKTILCLVFPEIERLGCVFSREILLLLYHFPSASKIKTLSEKEFIEKANNLLTHTKGRPLSLSLNHIYHLASTSIAQTWHDYEELLKIKIKRLLNLLDEKQHINNLIKEKSYNLFKNEINILCSIPGIGEESAIYFMAEIIDIKRFSNWKKLVGFCGLDPVIKQSGNFKASRRISKRGNAHARRIIWIMANSVKKSSTYFRSYYLKKRNEGKSFKEAIVATSTKLLRTIYALLNENRSFK